MEKQDEPAITPDPPHSPGTPLPPDLDVDLEKYQQDPDVPEHEDVQPGEGATEPPD
jgi:hypothetical protein